MPLLPFDILLSLPAFALVLTRVSGLMITAPLFGSSVIPARIRVAMVVALAVMTFPLVASHVPAGLTLTSVLTGVVGELLIGITIGLSLSLLLMGAEVGGMMVGRQAGLALANVFNPATDSQVSITGQVYTIAFTIVFLLAGGHRAAVAALLDTFAVIPVLSFQMNESVILLLAEMLAAAFILGIRLAGPVLIALFLVGTALAFLSRTMPQLNILTVGFAIRAIVALAVAALAMGASGDLFVDAIWDGVERIRLTFGLDPALSRLVN